MVRMRENSTLSVGPAYLPIHWARSMDLLVFFLGFLGVKSARREPWVMLSSGKLSYTLPYTEYSEYQMNTFGVIFDEFCFKRDAGETTFESVYMHMNVTLKCISYNVTESYLCKPK